MGGTIRGNASVCDVKIKRESSRKTVGDLGYSCKWGYVASE